MAIHLHDWYISEELPININYPTDSHSPMHSHEFFELMYVKRGLVQHTLNAYDCEMTDGDFIFIDLGDIHEYTCTGDFEIINFLFIPKSIYPSIGYCKNLSDLLSTPYFDVPGKKMIHRVPRHVMKDSTGEILDSILSIKNELMNPDIFSSEILKHRLIALIFKILQPKYSGQSEAEVSDITIKLLQLIAENYADDNLLVRAQKDFHYTLPYMSSVFKKDMGINFKEYLQKYRVNMAKKMLLYTDKKVGEICLRIGYSDNKYFCDIFKKYTKVTPSQYRKMIMPKTFTGTKISLRPTN
jgi:transcriptional regulatory protein